LPDTVPGRCAREFLVMANDGSAEAVRKFENTWASKKRLGMASVEERVGRVADLHTEWRGVRVKEVLASGANSISLAVEIASSGDAQMDFNMDGNEAGEV